MREHQRRPVQLCDDVRHCESFAASGHAEQRLLLVPAPNRFDELADGLRLVARGLIFRYELEIRHKYPLSPSSRRPCACRNNCTLCVYYNRSGTVCTAQNERLFVFFSDSLLCTKKARISQLQAPRPNIFMRLKAAASASSYRAAAFAGCRSRASKRSRRP